MRHVVLALFAAASFATAAQADPVRYDFSGSLTTDQIANTFASEAGLTTGTGSFSGHITFSDLAPDTDPTSAELYESTDFALSIGSYTFSSANVGFDAAYARVDAALPGFFLDFFSGANFSAASGESLALFLSFPGAVPGIVQNPGLAGSSASLLLTSDGEDFLFAEGAVTAFTTTATTSAVPEPATWAMLIGGFAIVGATMRAGRRGRLGRALA